MRFRVPEFFLGVMFAVAIFAMGVTFGSSSFSVKPDNNSPQKNAEQQGGEKISADGEKAQSLWIPTDSVGLYTLVLAAFTGLLVGVSGIQGYFLLRADKAARLAAEAAKRSADAVAQSAQAQIAVEGGRLICVPKDSSYWNDIGQWADRWPNSPEMRLEKAFNVLFVVKNYGKTPATIREVNAKITRSPTEPADVFITTPSLDLPGETVVGDGLQSLEFKVDFTELFKMEEAVSISGGTQKLWFYGRIVYDDVFGREGTQVFLYRVRARGGFSLYWDRTTHRKKEGQVTASQSE